MGYFAGRFAPMGAVLPSVVEATAFGFARAMVERAIPDAWSCAPPSDVTAARLDTMATILRDVLDVDSTARVIELVDLLELAVDGCDLGGRPLAAAWARVGRPTDPFGRLWLATTVLREHRGDGHVAACAAASLDGLESSITAIASGATTRSAIQPNRGWSDEEWEHAELRLQRRRIIDENAELTSAGLALRRTIEQQTDALAGAPIGALGPARLRRAITLARPMAARVRSADLYPHPNPMAAPAS